MSDGGPPASRLPMLAARGVSKSYGAAPAVGPVDLLVPRGQRLVLLGHNGSGKTTLLRISAGLLEPTAGSVTVGGHDVTSVAARASLSYLADQPVFYDDLSLWEHLEFIARLHDTGRARLDDTDGWERRAADLLDALGLAGRAEDLPTTFSRGLRQKAAIALAFVRPFELLLVDEPFVGLDLAGREALLELLGRAHGGGGTLVVATHELSTVAASDRVVALRDGVIVHDGPPAEADVAALVVR